MFFGTEYSIRAFLLAAIQNCEQHKSRMTNAASMSILLFFDALRGTYYPLLRFVSQVKPAQK